MASVAATGAASHLWICCVREKQGVVWVDWGGGVVRVAFAVVSHDVLGQDGDVFPGDLELLSGLLQESTVDQADVCVTGEHGVQHAVWGSEVLNLQHTTRQRREERSRERERERCKE